MNARERILTALNGEQPDRVPIFEMDIDPSIVVKLAKLLMPEAVKTQTVTDILGQESLETLDLYCLLVDRLGLDATSTGGLEWNRAHRRGARPGQIWHGRNYSGKG